MIILILFLTLSSIFGGLLFLFCHYKSIKIIHQSKHRIPISLCFLILIPSPIWCRNNDQKKLAYGIIFGFLIFLVSGFNVLSLILNNASAFNQGGFVHGINLQINQWSHVIYPDSAYEPKEEQFWQLETSFDVGVGVGWNDLNGATGNAIASGVDEFNNRWLIIGDQMRINPSETGNGEGQIHILKNDEAHSILVDQGGTNTATPGWFGYRVVVDWNSMRIAVGSTHAVNSATLGRGDVQTFLYNHKEDQWEFEQYIQHPETGPYDEFGGPLDLCGNWMIIGAYLHTPLENREGAAYFYELIDNSWVFRQKFNPETEKNARFGKPVAISKNWAMINSRINSQGRVFVYQLRDNEWFEHSVLIPDNGLPDETFGWPIALYGGRTALIGAAMRTRSSHRPGGIYFFEMENNHWVQKTYFSLDVRISDLPAISPKSQAPTLAHLQGDVAVIGCPFADAYSYRSGQGMGRGRVMTFKRNNNTDEWSYESTLMPNLDFGDWHGSSVYTDGSDIWTAAQGVASPHKTIRVFRWSEFQSN